MHESATAESRYSEKPARSRLVLKMALAAVLLLLGLMLGRAFGHRIPALEEWIAAQGAWGYFVFVGIVIVGTSLFVPDTVFAVAAGALFGVIGGTLVMVVASLLTAALDYGLARLFLQAPVRAWLERNPQTAAVAQAVDREGLRFQFPLRLTPVNPVSVSYMLGAAGTRFGSFMVACLGLAPALFVEVYFGYVAKHVAKASGKVSEHSTLHMALSIAGLVACVAMLVYTIRLARRAIHEAQTHAGDAEGPPSAAVPASK
ncbi:MAG TPA: VTT domain-containing protein [Pirellulales bacterium]|nr:VTT domain-containing protein [Pirellulales bacterium]